jgi:hypothetical protein
MSPSTYSPRPLTASSEYLVPQEGLREVGPAEAPLVGTYDPGPTYQTSLPCDKTPSSLASITPPPSSSK